MGRHELRAQYQIVVDGEIGPHFADVFDKLAVEPGRRSSTLAGPVRDQAELRGILELLAGLGHELVSVQRID